MTNFARKSTSVKIKKKSSIVSSDEKDDRVLSEDMRLTQSAKYIHTHNLSRNKM